MLGKIQDRIIRHESKQYCLNKDIRNELINLIAKEAEKVVFTQLKQAEYIALILNGIPDISHREQLTVILRFVQCDGESGAEVNETLWDNLTVNDSTGKGLLNVFLKRFEQLGLNLHDCRGQCYDNGASMKGKEAGLQARFLQINSKALYVPCANHLLNLVVVDSAKSSTEALLFLDVLSQLHVIFSLSKKR